MLPYNNDDNRPFDKRDEFDDIIHLVSIIAYFSIYWAEQPYTEF